MGSRGVFFALDEDEVAALLAAEDDDARADVLGDVEEAWDADWLAECDKSWDAMHRALGDGTLVPVEGEDVLGQVVLGAGSLMDDEDAWVSLVPAADVPAIARALDALDEATFAARYRSRVPPDYAPEFGDEDLAYTWSWLQQVRDLYRKAAQRQRAVVFTVDP